MIRVLVIEVPRSVKKKLSHVTRRESKLCFKARADRILLTDGPIVWIGLYLSSL